MEANHEFKVHGGEEAVPCLNDGDMVRNSKVMDY
jgi:hypothetical protein